MYKFLNLLESISEAKNQLQLELLHAYSKGVPIEDIEITDEMLTSAVTLRNKVREYTTKLHKK